MRVQFQDAYASAWVIPYQKYRSGAAAEALKNTPLSSRVVYVSEYGIGVKDGICLLTGITLYANSIFQNSAKIFAFKS